MGLRWIVDIVKSAVGTSPFHFDSFKVGIAETILAVIATIASPTPDSSSVGVGSQQAVQFVRIGYEIPAVIEQHDWFDQGDEDGLRVFTVDETLTANVDVRDIIVLPGVQVYANGYNVRAQRSCVMGLGAKIHDDGIDAYVANNGEDAEVWIPYANGGAETAGMPIKVDTYLGRHSAVAATYGKGGYGDETAGLAGVGGNGFNLTNWVVDTTGVLGSYGADGGIGPGNARSPGGAPGTAGICTGAGITPTTTDHWFTGRVGGVVFRPCRPGNSGGGGGGAGDNSSGANIDQGGGGGASSVGQNGGHNVIAFNHYAGEGTISATGGDTKVGGNGGHGFVGASGTPPDDGGGGGGGGGQGAPGSGGHVTYIYNSAYTDKPTIDVSAGTLVTNTSTGGVSWKNALETTPDLFGLNGINAATAYAGTTQEIGL